MLMSSDNVELFIISVVSMCEPVKKFGHNIWVVMTNKEVINMPAYCYLLAINDFVGNAGS
jgi:hypothetical protein